MRIFWFTAFILLLFPLGNLFLTEAAPAPAQIQAQAPVPNASPFDEDIRPAAEQIHKYLKYLKGKRLGLVVNQTSTVVNTHLVDTLKALGCQVQKIFAPEHGFRGTADRGEHIKDAKDPKTGLPIVSMFGKNRMPSAEILSDVDLMIFDIQDVGVRFYTYTSTMTYIMQACAKHNKPLLVLDRPNPLGHYVGGPIMQPDQETFVGLHPVPVIHGLTTAEYARMINEEGWLEGGVKCELHHVECLNYNHKKFYKLPVKPSPNLPNMKSIYLYPHLCLFEGTVVSVGRGTNKQFQCYGHPDFSKGSYTFTPKPMPGAKHPVLEGKQCKGFDLSTIPYKELQNINELQISYICEAYQSANTNLRNQFFLKNNFLNKLIGNTTFMQQVKTLQAPQAIQNSWKADLIKYKELRKKYLLYQDFE
jgi:uncharacterized protein YbbC (DUF1343 family)